MSLGLNPTPYETTAHAAFGALRVSLGQAETVPEPKHPMLPFLVDLERPLDSGVERDYEPTELVRYAVGASDYWADLALGWLDHGVPTQPLVTELEQLETDKSRPQNLRHRARRLRKSTRQTP
ncbi:hypothetical protein ACWEOO_38370 [Kribbella sp. NPDC004138]